MEFSLDVLAAAGFIAFAAAFIHGSIGLGFPMVATPLLALFIDIQTAIILTLTPSLLTNIISIRSEGRLLTAFRRHLSLALAVMAGSAVGTQVLILSHSEIFKALLAAAIFLYLLAEKIDFQLAWVAEHQRLSKFIFGVSAGILGGLTNVMAPVLIVYTLEAKHSKSETIQALNFCFLSGKTAQLLLFTVNGRYSLDQLPVSAIMCLAAFLALALGMAVRKKIETKSYRKILRFVLMILALLLLFQVLPVFF